MSDKDNAEESSPVEQTSRGLRAVLFDQIDKLRSGKCGVDEASAVAKLAGQIVNTVMMEIKVAQLRRDYPSDTKLVVPPPLQLKK